MNIYEDLLKEQFGIIEEGIEKFLDKIDLTDEQRDEIIDHFNKFPNKTKLVNWHKKDLSYEDIKKAMYQTSKRQKKKGNLKKDTDFYYFKENDIDVIFPLNHQAMRYFGKNSEWCVSGNDDSYWNNYIADNNILVIFKIDNEEYLGAYKYNGYLVELADINNNHIDIDEYDEDEYDEYSSSQLEEFELYERLDDMYHGKNFPVFEEYFEKTREHLRMIMEYKKDFLSLLKYKDFNENSYKLVDNINKYNIDVINDILYERENFDDEEFLNIIKKYDRFNDILFLYTISKKEYDKSEIQKINISKNRMLKLIMKYGFILVLKNKKSFDIVMENTNIKNLENNRDFIYVFIDDFLREDLKYLEWIDEYKINLDCSVLNQEMIKELLDSNKKINIDSEDLRYLKIIFKRIYNFLSLDKIIYWSYNVFKNISDEDIIKLCELSTINGNSVFLYNTKLLKNVVIRMKLFEYFCKKNYVRIITVNLSFSIKRDDKYYLDRIKIMNKYVNDKFKEMMKNGGYIVSMDKPTINSDILNFILSDENKLINPYVSTTFKVLNSSLNNGITARDYIRFLDKLYEHTEKLGNTDIAYVVLRYIGKDLPVEVYLSFAEHERKLIRNSIFFIEAIVDNISDDNIKMEFLKNIKQKQDKYGITNERYIDELISEITGNEKELSNESKETLTEIPHIEVNDTIFDLELEKLHDVNDIIVFFKKLFSGRTLKDKHGNTISLKTREEKLEFLLNLANSFVFKKLISKIKENSDFHFFKFFKKFIKNEQYNENFKNNIFEVIEEAYYLNDIFFDNTINLDDIEFSIFNKGNTLYECKKIVLNENIIPIRQKIIINVNHFKNYEEFRKSLIESLMNIYLNINNKLYLENTNKKKKFLYRNMKKNINNYGKNIYNNWIEL